MASLNDYNWHEDKYNWHENRTKSRGHGPWRRLWLQLACSLGLLLAVAGLINRQGLAGEAARYVAGPGLSIESSWFSFGRTEQALPAQAPLPAQGESPEIAPVPALKFSAPASGVVVQGMALDAAGLTTAQGIIIQGVAGQSVKAAAAGEVHYLGESEKGFIVEIAHQGGYSSVYQGLSELTISAGQQLYGGESIGITASGELLFALFYQDQELDPLQYLFQQNI